MQGTEKQLNALRNKTKHQLRKGDYLEIKEMLAAKGISIEIIRNYYSGRATDAKHIPLILSASLKLIKNREKNLSKVLRKLKRAA